MKNKLIFSIVFIMIVIIANHDVHALEENIIPPNFSNQESKSFKVFYDHSVFSKKEIKMGLVILERFLKEECSKSTFCHLPDYKIPIVYLNEKGPELGSANLRGFVTTLNDCRGIVVYGGAKKKDDYLKVEDILRHETCHILIKIPNHWASEGYATLSENQKKQNDRLKFAYLAQNKLSKVNILEKFFTKYDLSSFDDFLNVMDENKTKSYYGISYSLTTWMIEKTSSRDDFVKFMNELGEATNNSELWRQYAPEAYERLQKNNGIFNWSVMIEAREKYIENYLTPKYFGKKMTLPEMEKEWRAWTAKQFQERFIQPCQ